MVYCIEGFRKIYHHTAGLTYEFPKAWPRDGLIRTIKAAVVLPVDLYANWLLSRLCGKDGMRYF